MDPKPEPQEPQIFALSRIQFMMIFIVVYDLQTATQFLTYASAEPEPECIPVP